MNEREISIAEWIEAVVSATRKLATVSLSLDNVSVIGNQDSLPENYWTAYIPLTASNTSVRVCIAAG